MDRMNCERGALTRGKEAEKLVVYSEFGMRGSQCAYVGRVGEKEGRGEMHSSPAETRTRMTPALLRTSPTRMILTTTIISQ